MVLLTDQTSPFPTLYEGQSVLQKKISLFLEGLRVKVLLVDKYVPQSGCLKAQLPIYGNIEIN